MGKVIRAHGQVAAVPYEVEGHQVSSLEELAVVLMDSAQYLNHSLQSRKLADWLERECALPELAGELRGRMGKAQLEQFVWVILAASELFDHGQMNEAMEKLRSTEPQSEVDRQIGYARYLAASGQQHRAIRCLDELLRKIPSSEKSERSRRDRAEVFAEKGRMCGEIFLFKEAFRCFQKAYDLCHEQACAYLMVCAMYLLLEPEEFDRQTSVLPELRELAGEVRQNAQRAEEAYGRSAAAQQILRLRTAPEGPAEESARQLLARLEGEYRGNHGADE